jgi:flavin reductase (DIM6/NTAB) family NADH-FMN oxidoreductase RutF
VSDARREGGKETVVEKLPLAKAFLLIEPGPVLWVTTRGADGRNNLMTATWHMVMAFGEAPRFALLTGPWNYSCQALLETRECVLAIPTVDLAHTVVDVGMCSGQETDKFGRFGLTPRAAEQVTAPLVAECLGNIECRVVEHIARHDLFILDGVQAWHDPGRSERRTLHAVGDGRFVVDGETLDLRARMAAKIPPGV